MKSMLNLVVISTLFLSSLQAGDVKLSMDKEGVEINAGSAGKFILPMPNLGAVGNDGFEKPVVEVSGKRAKAKYPNGALLEAEVSKDEVTYEFSDIPDHANSWMFMMAIPGKFSEGAKFGLEGKPVQDFPAVAGTEQHIVKGINADKFILIAPGGDGFTIEFRTNWFGLQDNRAKGWGNQFVYSFLYDIRAHPGVKKFTLKIEEYKP